MRQGFGRSREGAWIEMALASAASLTIFSRSREGAWIEILGYRKNGRPSAVAPARERGLKSIDSKTTFLSDLVAPARERGLKFA